MHQVRGRFGRSPFAWQTVRRTMSPHSEFLSQSPSGRTIIVHHPDDSFSVIDLLLVTELKVDEYPQLVVQQS